MMRQYRQMKEQHTDAILFFRLGDFYEMFFEDALLASKLLQITLTARNKGEHKAPMCGVPYHAANNYIAKLTRLGHKVAICEQLSDPRQPGIVKRDVVRVITPGTTLDEHILEAKSNNFVMAITRDAERFGLAYADISTGEIKTTEVENFKELMTELERIRPSEVILSSALMKSDFFSRLKNAHPDMFFFAHDASNITENASTLLLNYLQETQKTDLSHLQNVQHYQLSEFMPLDEATLKNLELISTLRENKKEGSLLWVLDQTVTSMGGRKLKFILTHPLQDAEQIRARLESVDELFCNQRVIADMREILQQMPDFERMLARLSLGHGNARDLNGLKHALQTVPSLQSMLMALQSPLLKAILNDMDAMDDLVALIEKTIVVEPPISVREGSMIKDGFNAELDAFKKINREGKDFIQSLQEKEIKRTGINSLKVRFNNVFGYYIEVSKANLQAVPDDYIRKQTLVNAERFMTPELKEYEEKVVGAEEKIMILEYEIFNDLRLRVVKEIRRIQKLANAVAMLDTICSFAFVALQNRYCKPTITDDIGNAATDRHSQNHILIENGRHPVVERMNAAGQFVGNDALLDHDMQQLLLITGPNMGGKSTYLRQIALIALMAHIGSFVPAAKAEISLLDRIFTRVGASDNLVKGQSTFMVEMQETAYILEHATEKSLIILDEIGRGTSTYDGMSIAWAILEFLHDKLKAKTLFATHYHELISLVEKLPHAKNFSVAVKKQQDGITFLYKIVAGGVDQSYGIEVAKLAELPGEVISRARQILVDLERQHQPLTQPHTKSPTQPPKIQVPTLF